MSMIPRKALEERIRVALGRSQVTAMLGPRQCGKSTLARLIAGETKAKYFDLESASDLRMLEQPHLALEGLEGLVIIDEIQRMPGIFPTLRVLSDRKPLPARFLILGSSSPGLIRDSSESLAGRIEFVEMGGFSLPEVGEDKLEQLWIRGGFPRSFLAKDDSDSRAWREKFVQTFLERDIPSLGISIPSLQIRRFWMMLAHYHGQAWNGSEIGRSLGVSDHTARRYLDLLSATFMVRQLQPWHENIGKRQVKSPKVYFRDSGMFHALMDLRDKDSVMSSPKLGASWEGFMMEEAIKAFNPNAAFFWAVHGLAEIDLFFISNARRYGVEFKWNDAPSATRSMRTAMTDLKLERLFVVYPGKKGYLLDDNIEVIPAKTIYAAAKSIQ
ncbi:MAG: ATP-binding protein [Victivallales bacterium]|nr:ATP-binding protein [Victivallales bacterium]